MRVVCAHRTECAQCLLALTKSSGALKKKQVVLDSLERRQVCHGWLASQVSWHIAQLFLQIPEHIVIHKQS